MSDQVAEVNSKYLVEAASNAIPIGYKQTEVGVIPEDWEIHCLGEVMNLINGCAFKPSDWKSYGTPIIRIQNLNDFEAQFNFFDGQIDGRHIIKPGDLLFAWSGTLGTSFGARVWKGPVGVLNQHIFKVAPNNQIITQNFSLLALRQAQQLIEREAHGFKTSFVHIKKSDLTSVKLKIPRDLKEQNAVANALSDVDALIQGLEKLIAKKQAIKTATMQQLLTGRTRLPQFALREDGSTTNSSGTNLDAETGGPKGEGQDGLRKGTKQSELGEIPEDWKVVSIAELGQVDPENLGSTTAPDYEFNYVSLEQVERGVLLGTIKTIFRDAPSRARRILKKGDVLVSTVRPNLMSHYFVQHEDHDLVCSTGFSVVRFFEEKLYPGYLYQHLFSSVINNQIEMLISGSNYPAINSGDVRQLKVQIGGVEEQTAIATILSDMDEEIQALQQRLNKTRQIKQGMMQELLTGKTRLLKGENA
ncbi:restriction endonuclease subunit S [Methylotuvimicrobium sp. KM1]|uniref:restriction endonuclease subunit S n=1 Tax=Methylotuvimicrobium sp. KM1 TaxID=3377707 RepID=UPI00384E23C7